MDKKENNHDLYFFYCLKSGDEKAFDYLFNFYYSGMIVYANKFLNDNHLSEEIVQGIFVKLWQGRKSIEIEVSVKSYLFQSVRNKCLDIIKHKKIKEDYAKRFIEDQASEATDDHTWNTFIEAELYAILSQAVSKLPQECGRIFRYSRFKNLKNKEIAEKLGISVKTVENQIFKALKLIRNELKDYLSL